MSKRNITKARLALLLPALLLPAALAAQSGMQVHSNGAVHVATGGQITFFGNLHNDGTFSSTGGTVVLNGSTLQKITGAAAITTHDLTVNNANHVRVSNKLEIQHSLTFTNGKIFTDKSKSATQFIHFLDGATYTGAGNARFVDGVVRKTGDEAFTFPVGEGNDMQAAGISAPSNAAHHFTAHYKHSNAGADGYNTSSFDANGCVKGVAGDEYWIIDRTGGDSQAMVTLQYDANSSRYSDSKYMLIVRWTNGQWVTEGNGGTTGTREEGSVSTGTGCGKTGDPMPVKSYSPFTFGTTNPEAVLPIELLAFNAEAEEHLVHVYWTTASETNNDFFTVERSVDGKMFLPAGQLPGAGTSTQKHSYAFTDTSPLGGISYYRLRQTDFDGMFSYSRTVAVEVSDLPIAPILIYPNPTEGRVTVHAVAEELLHLKLYNTLGQELPLTAEYGEQGQGAEYNLTGVPAGVYFLKTLTFNRKLIVK